MKLTVVGGGHKVNEGPIIILGVQNDVLRVYNKARGTMTPKIVLGGQKENTASMLGNKKNWRNLNKY
jgi:hypothetical protein